jgi:hypothetical protein
VAHRVGDNVRQAAACLGIGRVRTNDRLDLVHRLK